MKNNYSKIFNAQKSICKFGLTDIKIGLDKNIEFPFYGLLFAQKIQLENLNNKNNFIYKSFLEKDKNSKNFEETLAYQLLVDKEIKITNKIVKENKKQIINYYLLYYNLNSSYFKDTKYLSDIKYYCRNKSVKLEIEYQFVLDNEYIIILNQIHEITNLYNYNFTELILDGIKELKENPLYFFGGNELLIENNNVLELETCSIKTGLYKTYSFNFNELKFLGEFLSDNLCSCRIVDIIF